MFEVGASTSFRAFHRMPDHPPPENERHPHDYRVEVVAERERLDERGMVCDLDVLDAALAEVADRLRDADCHLHFHRDRPRLPRVCIVLCGNRLLRYSNDFRVAVFRQPGFFTPVFRKCVGSTRPSRWRPVESQPQAQGWVLHSGLTLRHGPSSFNRFKYPADNPRDTLKA